MSLSGFGAKVPLSGFCSQAFLGRIEKILRVPNAVTWLPETPVRLKLSLAGVFPL